jgi:hypothetical protein
LVETLFTLTWLTHNIAGCGTEILPPRLGQTSHGSVLLEWDLPGGTLSVDCHESEPLSVTVVTNEGELLRRPIFRSSDLWAIVEPLVA